MVGEVARINRTIKSLASVLNSPDLPYRITVSSPVSIAIMVKKPGDTLYVFAVAMLNQPSRPQLAIGGGRRPRRTAPRPAAG
jgi:hypothetical protein